MTDRQRGKPECTVLGLDAAWVGLGAIIASLGQDGFDRRLFDWVASLAPVRVLFAIELFENGQPGRVVVTEGSDEDLTRRARAVSQDYAAGDFAQDDTLQSHRKLGDGRLELVVQEGRNRHDHFRIKYYDAMGTPHEVSAFRSDGPTTLYLGVSSGPGGYAATDILRLRAVLPVVIGLVFHHARVEDTGRSVGADADREAQFSRLLRNHCPACSPSAPMAQI